MVIIIIITIVYIYSIRRGTCSCHGSIRLHPSIQYRVVYY